MFNANQYKQNQATNLCDLRSAKVIGHQGVPEWQSVSIHTVPGYQITKVPEKQSVGIHTVRSGARVPEWQSVSIHTVRDQVQSVSIHSECELQHNCRAAPCGLAASPSAKLT